jgi:MFS family permease
LQNAYQVPIWIAALTTTAPGIGTITTSIISVKLIRRWGGQRVARLGAIVAGLGFGSMIIPIATVHDGSVAFWNMPSQLAAGAGLGLLLTPLLTVVLPGIKAASAGAAVGLLTTAQMVSASLGIGFIGLLFQIPVPSSAEAATPAQTTAGMTWALLYNPVIFALSLLIMRRLAKPRHTETDTHAEPQNTAAARLSSRS